VPLKEGEEHAHSLVAKTYPLAQRTSGLQEYVEARHALPLLSSVIRISPLGVIENSAPGSHKVRYYGLLSPANRHLLPRIAALIPHEEGTEPPRPSPPIPPTRQ